ncbi:MAG: M20 family metallopeptidase [Planctomycetota bacterium]
MRNDGSTEAAAARLHRLIAFPSVSSTSNLAVTEFVSDRLRELGFAVAQTKYEDANGVLKANLVAKRTPVGVRAEANTDSPGGLAYFCHTDVVPAEHWIGPHEGSEPFVAVDTNDRIYGRGACDMKGSLSAMLAAVARVSNEEQARPIWIVSTADEEVGFDGAKHLVQHCDAYRDLVAAQPISIIGEPTELDVVYAHKGIRGFKVTSRGRAGHSATRFGINANEAMVPMLVKLAELCNRSRDESGLQDQRFDPPHLSWNFGVSDQTRVVNITPERSVAWVSIRTMPGIDGEGLFEEVRLVADRLGLEFQPFSGCHPLWTEPDEACVSQMQTIAGGACKTVCYATDGGVFEELRHRVVIGPGSIEQAHTVDEWISIEQLARGIDVYEQAIRRWCC